MHPTWALWRLNITNSFKLRTSKRHIPVSLCGELPVTGGVPVQTASNTESISMTWHHRCSLKILKKEMSFCDVPPPCVGILRPRQNVHHHKRHFQTRPFHECCCISIQISRRCVPMVLNKDKPRLAQIMARRAGHHHKKKDTLKYS